MIAVCKFWPRAVLTQQIANTKSNFTGIRMTTRKTANAILTDVQFWVPALVLAGGIALLVFLH